MNSKQRFRARFIGIGILLIAGVLTSSLYSTSIIHGQEYKGKAQSQYVKPQTSLFARNSIYFSAKDGTQSAAASVGSGYTIFINPKLLVDSKVVYEALSNYLTLDRGVFMSKANKPNGLYEVLANKIDEKMALSIQGLGLKGVGVAQETWRVYPGGSLASHELGIIGESVASSSVSGRYGLERYYNDILVRSGSGSSVNIFAQLFSEIGSVFSSSVDSGDLVTSIEPTVQTYLEKVLSQAQLVWNPDEIGGIIMDPNTGLIYAMASHPTFDPNDLKSIKSVSIFSNPLVENVYEMGSIMKPLTMATALDSGAVDIDSTYDDLGCLTLNEKKICNFDKKARGVIPMQQILSQSLNIGAATIALKTGAKDFTKYFSSFGLGGKSGIDLPNEAMPLTDNLKNPQDIDIATASYGQGIAVSPLGMIRALSVIASGGYVVTPHLVKQINHTDDSIKKVDTKRTGPVLKPETVDEVKRMLVSVVDISLAQGKLKKEHYTMAAKTGTAAIADHVNGGYYSDQWLHSFFGFFPAYNPKFIVFLYQKHPKGAQYASETLTKPFDELATFLLNYYNVPWDR
ncbi:MAG: penicillin-binding protein 2 [Candidatus Taylorbacteria bacterium]|nr:penicillin-binding protein 2 [Candidatus Taylorbacteria bacterium]